MHASLETRPHHLRNKCHTPTFESSLQAQELVVMWNIIPCINVVYDYLIALYVSIYWGRTFLPQVIPEISQKNECGFCGVTFLVAPALVHPSCPGNGLLRKGDNP